MTQFGLGGHRVFDPRNLNYLIKDRMPVDSATHKAGLLASRLGGLKAADTDVRVANVEAAAAALKARDQTKYHNDSAWWGDQGSSPACTGFSGVHLLADGPMTQAHPKAGPPLDPFTLYQENQKNDRKMGYYWAEGASSLALAKSLKSFGYISGYYWGYDLDAFLAAIKRGPVLFGTDWLEGMDNPDPTNGLIRATGQNRGGHEILINGVNFTEGIIRLKNSWGRAWGKGGHAYLPFQDFEKLLGQGGDLLMVAEIKKA